VDFFLTFSSNLLRINDDSMQQKMETIWIHHFDGRNAGFFPTILGHLSGGMLSLKNLATNQDNSSAEKGPSSAEHQVS